MWKTILKEKKKVQYFLYYSNNSVKILVNKTQLRQNLDEWKKSTL